MAIFPDSKQMPGAGGVEGATVKMEKNGSVVLHARLAELRPVARDDGVRRSSPTCSASRRSGSALTGTFDSALSPWGVSSSNSGNNFHLYDVGAVHGAATRLRERC